MGAAGSIEGKSNEEVRGEFLKKLEEIKTSHPNNLCAKHLTKEYFESLSEDDQKILYRCAISGIDNADSGLGCYAMGVDDYEKFRPFFDAVIREYHKAKPEDVHVTDWDISDVGNGGVLDLTELGLNEVSMRVRVGRNLSNFPLPGAMTKEDRINFEKTMLKAFEKLKENPEYGGTVYSLTPEFAEGEANPNLIDDAKYQELVKAHVMFKNMADDTYLASAGISSDWPYGRGCYQSEDKQFIIWFGEEDQLRIMCMKKGTKLNEVFDRLKEALKVVESIEGITFATSKDYGYITSCPSNLGTGMRFSCHIQVPNLTKGGDDAKCKEICKPLGLSVRGMGGEHTPIGEDGTIDLSPSARLFIKEKEIMQNLYQGIKDLMAKEKEACEGGDAPKAEGEVSA